MIQAAEPAAPDPILPPCYRLHAYDQIGSTNDEAKRLALTEAPAGTVVWARRQTAGRGRQERRWISPPGNLYVSYLLRPSQPAAEMAQIGFVAGLAVADCLAELGCPSPKLKWPNDVLLEGGKAAGILLESSASGGTVDWLIAGIGINLSAAPPDTPYKAVALSDFVPPPSPVAALEGLTAALGDWLKRWEIDGFAAIRRAWLERSFPPGSPMAVREGMRVTEGFFADLDQDGALLLATVDGQRRFLAGDVFFPAG